MKRILLAMLIFIVAFSFFKTGPVNAADDITGHFFEEEMRELIEKGIMTGYNDGTYRPNRDVTRAEFTAFLVRALEIETLATSGYSVAELSETTNYSDIDPGAWYYPAITAASTQDIVNGYPDGTFKPGKKISRQEMAVMMLRAVESKGVISEKAPLDFQDADEIHPIYREAVQRLIYLEIINGKVDKEGHSFFAPLDKTTRAQTAGVIGRMLDIIHPPVPLDYKVVNLSTNEEPVVRGEYETFQEAKSAAKASQVVMKGNNVLWIDEGIAVSNKYTVIYENPDFTSHHTYVTSGVEMEFIDSTEDWVKVQTADVTGYVKPDTVNLNSSHLVTDRSYYQNKNGDLVHFIYNPIRESWASYVYGKAPSFMAEGTKYYSWNGHTFHNTRGTKVGVANQFFNKMPLYTDTKYTAEQLDEYIRYAKPDSPLIGTGDDFKKAELMYGTNAMYLLAHAIHESNWGKSAIAQDKNNLFGIGAVDSNPYEGAYTYESFEEGILEAASDFIIPGYFKISDWRYEGDHLGNKNTGMNVRYASDPYWGQKIAGYMYRMDKYLSNKYGTKPELGKNDLAMTIADSVNVRSEPKVGDNQLYQIEESGTTFEILRSVHANGTWYNVIPKNVLGNSYSEMYVYSHGYKNYGTSLKLLPVVE
ncbi:S-layer homology domain-containing protein [Thalassobacillus pellis]|uniref:S-layer homology domain-containing protein n=1 Tax=Thalassobacillus pellis TaxID=748008 RepID=UPI00195FAF0D|nr:S-layer homology domain-containing protein [Thalassobacillus pellis]MBM7551689.1 beta-N-acetylglucosaminidase [Thalassobacillus pellis]